MKNEQLILERIEKLKQECLREDVVPQIMIVTKENGGGYLSSFYQDLQPLRKLLTQAKEQVDGAV